MHVFRAIRRLIDSSPVRDCSCNLQYSTNVPFVNCSRSSTTDNGLPLSQAVVGDVRQTYCTMNTCQGTSYLC